METAHAHASHDGGAWVRRSLVRVLVYGPLLLCGPLLLLSSQPVMHHLLYDFKGGLWDAGVAVLHGHSPYQPGFLSHQAALMHAGHLARGETSQNSFSIPVYPALANVVIVPLSLLPLWAAGVIYTLLSVAAMLGGLRLVGVRDLRCLAVVLVSWPFLFGLGLGAIGPFLVLGTGAAWRWRDHAWRGAVAIATIVAVKVFPWPLGVWLLITRRYRALLVCVVAGIVLTFGAWALIGFHGLLQYPQMLSDMSFLQENRAMSVVAVLVIAGVPSGVASAIAIALGAVMMLAAWRMAGGPDGDRRAFGLAVLAALTATPIVWDHYMVLLFIPIALASPRFSAAWLIPLWTPILTAISWVIPPGPANQPFSPNTLHGAIPWLALEAMTAVVLLTTPQQRRAVRTRLLHWPGSRVAAPAVAEAA